MPSPETDTPTLSMESWIEPDEGQLSVDVIETNDKVIIRSAIAGVNPKDLDVYIGRDMVTIRGTRHAATEDVGATYHFRECYWGGFSRTVILPAHIKPDESTATCKNGILTIAMPKSVIEVKIPISFDDEDL